MMVFSLYSIENIVGKKRKFWLLYQKEKLFLKNFSSANAYNLVTSKFCCLVGRLIYQSGKKLKKGQGEPKIVATVEILPLCRPALIAVSVGLMTWWL